MAQHIQQMDKEMERCIQNCLACYRICLETINYCLEKGGRHAEPGHIRLLLDCAEVCQTSAGFLIRQSDLHSNVCEICAEICEICAEDCAEFSSDVQMAACAEACRRCAESCRRMSGTQGRKAA